VANLTFVYRLLLLAFVLTSVIVERAIWRASRRAFILVANSLVLLTARAIVTVALTLADTRALLRRRANFLTALAYLSVASFIVGFSLWLAVSIALSA